VRRIRLKSLIEISDASILAITSLFYSPIKNYLLNSLYSSISIQFPILPLSSRLYKILKSSGITQEEYKLSQTLQNTHCRTLPVSHEETNLTLNINMNNNLNTTQTMNQEPQAHRIPSHLGRDRFNEASKFLSKFFPVEWKIFALTSVEKYLRRISKGDNLALYQFEDDFANLAYNCLLTVAQKASCLLTGQSPLVPPGDPFCFKDTFSKDQFEAVEGFPEILPQINVEGNEHNLFHGVFTKDRAIEHGEDLQRLGKKLLTYINHAWNKKGGNDNPNDIWNFKQVLRPAADNYINACIPGNAKIVSPETWSLLYGNEDTLEKLDSELSSEDENTSSKSFYPHPMVQEAITKEAPNTPAPSPVGNKAPKLASVGEGKNEPASCDGKEYSTKANSTPTPRLTINSEGDIKVEDVPPKVNSVYEQPHEFNKQVLYSKAAFVPSIHGIPLDPDCPCGLYHSHLSTFTHGCFHNDGNLFNEAFNTPPVQSKTNFALENGEESRALIPHPIYGRDAQNALIPYSPECSLF
jgi:hypothetical protein